MERDNTGVLNEAGISKLGTLFFAGVIAAVVFTASQILPFYYNYYEILGLMEEQGRKASVFTDDQITQTLMARIKKLDIPLENPEDLKINRFNGQIQIDMKYEESFDVPTGTGDDGEPTYYHIHTFPFNPHIEQNY